MKKILKFYIYNIQCIILYMLLYIENEENFKIRIRQMLLGDEL